MRIYKVLLLTIFISACSSNADHGGDPHKITITHLAPETVFGYYFRCGDRSGVYDELEYIFAIAGAITEIPLLTVNPPFPDGRHYCMARAYDFNSVQSPNSNEVVFTTKDGDLVTAPPAAPSIQVD